MPFYSTTSRCWLPVAAWAVLGLLSAVPGCGGDDPGPDTNASGDPVTTDPVSAKSSPGDTQELPPAPWIKLLASAVDHLDHARLDEADKQVAAVEALLSEADDGDEKVAGLKELELSLIHI